MSWPHFRRIRAFAPVNTSRFNYDYNEEELGGLAAQLVEFSKSVERTHVVFDNNIEDQGQRNARSGTLKAQPSPARSN